MFVSLVFVLSVRNPSESSKVCCFLISSNWCFLLLFSFFCLSSFIMFQIISTKSNNEMFRFKGETKRTWMNHKKKQQHEKKKNTKTNKSYPIISNLWNRKKKPNQKPSFSSFISFSFFSFILIDWLTVSFFLSPLFFCFLLQLFDNKPSN